jgi:hypothetical protein
MIYAATKPVSDASKVRLDMAEIKRALIKQYALTLRLVEDVQRVMRRHPDPVFSTMLAFGQGQQAALHQIAEQLLGVDWAEGVLPAQARQLLGLRATVWGDWNDGEHQDRG